MEAINNVFVRRLVLPVVVGLVVVALVIAIAISRVENAIAPLKVIEVAIGEAGVEGATTEAKVLVLIEDRQAIEDTMATTSVQGGTLAIRVQLLAQENVKLGQELVTAKEKIKSLEDQIANGEASEHRLTFLSSENKELGVELDATRAELSGLREQLSAARIEFNSVEKEKARVKGELAQLQGVLETAGVEQGQFEDWVSGLNDKLQGLHQENARLVVEKTRFETEAEATKARFVAAKAEAEATKARFVEAKAEAEATMARLTAIESEAVSLKNEAVSLKSETKSLKNEANSLKRKTRTLEAEISSAKSSTAPPPKSFTIYFGFDNWDLTPSSRAELARAASVAKSINARVFSVTGYADRWGNVAYNLRLSSARADAVVAALHQELENQSANGVAIRKIAKGESELPVSTPDQTREEENRRVDIKLE